MSTSETVKLAQKVRYVGVSKAGVSQEFITMTFRVQGSGDSVLGVGQIDYVCPKNVADGFVVGNSYILTIS